MDRLICSISGISGVIFHGLGSLMKSFGIHPGGRVRIACSKLSEGYSSFWGELCSISMAEWNVVREPVSVGKLILERDEKVHKTIRDLWV